MLSLRIHRSNARLGIMVLQHKRKAAVDLVKADIELCEVLLLSLYPLTHLRKSSTQDRYKPGAWSLRESFFPLLWIFVRGRSIVWCALITDFVIKVVPKLAIRISCVPLLHNSCHLLGDGLFTFLKLVKKQNKLSWTYED
jgi:hypothetical protein